MSYDPQKHHRHSIRLKGYDYTRPGAYFVTICAQNRELLFDPQPVREMIQRWWDKLPAKFPNVQTEAFVIMPNHIHGIVVLVGVDPCVDPLDPCVDPEMGRTRGIVPTDPEMGRTRGFAPSDPEMGRTRGFAPTDRGVDPTDRGVDPNDTVSLAEVVQWFKTMTTNEYMRGVKQMGWSPFPGKFWQRNYYEHIIRDDNDLNRIRAYISNNPRRWQEDRFHPCAPPNKTRQYL